VNAQKTTRKKSPMPFTKKDIGDICFIIVMENQETVS